MGSRRYYVEVGKPYGDYLTVIRPGKVSKHTYAVCRCKCGKEKEIRLDKLEQKQALSCGCLKKKRAYSDLVGEIFSGNMEVIEATPHIKVPNGKNKVTGTVTCRCLKCGTIKEKVVPSQLKGKNPHVRSCGCLKNVGGEDHPGYKHGATIGKSRGTYDPLWVRWWSMRQRCSNPKQDLKNAYVNRGISVCDEWNDSETGFQKFKEWTEEWCFKNGYKSYMEMLDAGLTIERLDVNLGYSPDNCSWITHLDQAQNRRTTHKVTIRGKEYSFADAWRKVGHRSVSYQLALRRVNGMGWDEMRALTTPNKWGDEPKPTRIYLQRMTDPRLNRRV
jgi:hypothetical protein